MRNVHPGCLSINGVIAALLTLLVVLGISALRGGVLYSPGGLNAQTGEKTLGGAASHAVLGGRCSACHTAPWERERMAGRCLQCHTEIQARERDFHRVMLAESRATTCTPCHTDHNGPQGALTVMELANFPHDGLGFSLAAHQEQRDGREMTCGECHGEQIGRVDPGVCLDCHRDLAGEYMTQHVQDFGPGCLNCHDGLDTYGAAFDHNLLAFPLQGAHAQTGCGQCHHPANTIADLRLAPGDCAGCHQEDDAHAGQFGTDCGACHTAASWEQATFDHNQTAFPLAGRHQALECEACHREGVFQGTPTACAGCHQQDDAHAGQFGTDCGACHTPASWEEATFDHSRTAFPLAGAHAGVECSSCHKNEVFAGTPSDCASCHADPPYHAGLFGADCAACHTAQAWSPARYAAAHTFPIDHGEGGPSSCKICHPQSLDVYTCYGCHEHNQPGIEAKHREEGISNFQDCTRCHATGQEEEGEGEGGGGED